MWHVTLTAPQRRILVGEEVGEEVGEVRAIMEAEEEELKVIWPLPSPTRGVSPSQEHQRSTATG